MTNKLLSSCLNHLTELVAFDTSNPPKAFRESGIIEYLQQQLTLPQVSVEVMDYGNNSINILVKKGQPKYLFNFHLDTVPSGEGWDTNPYHLEIREDKAFGLGSCDIKGAAAAMLSVIEHYHHAISHFALLFSSDEEHGNSVCVRQFLNNKHAYKGVIVAEPTQAKAVTAHRGINTFELTIQSQSGHSSEPRALLDNTIHQFSQWANKAIDIAQTYQQQCYQNLSGICFNIGQVNGGVKPNIIASQLKAKFGVRPLPGLSSHMVKDEFCSITTENTTISTSFEAPSLPEELDDYRSYHLAKLLGLPLAEPVNFWTEASLFHQAGYPAIVYGPGNIQQAHTANEYVCLSQLESVIHEYYRILSHEP